MDSAKVSKAIDEAVADPRPSLIRCKTIIGYGAPNKQGTAATHGAPQEYKSDDRQHPRTGVKDPVPERVQLQVVHAIGRDARAGEHGGLLSEDGGRRVA